MIEAANKLATLFTFHFSTLESKTMAMGISMNMEAPNNIPSEKSMPFTAPLRN